MPSSDNPNPKGSPLKNFFVSAKRKLTYADFNLEMYLDFRHQMDEFRKNCYGEDMQSLWEDIEKRYLPESIDALKVSAEYTLDTDGNATPNRFFATSSDDELIEVKEPLVAIKIHTGLSILTSRTPDVLWDSDNSNYDGRAPVLNALRLKDWDDEVTRSQYVMMWFHTMLYGTSFWRRFYDEHERTVNFVQKVDLATGEETTKEDTFFEVQQTVGESLSPLDVWIDPATLPGNPRSMRYGGYDKVYDYQTFLRLFEGVSRPKDLAEVQPTAIEGYSGDNWVKCSYFEHKDLDLYYVVANDKFPILKRRLPWNHKDLTFHQTNWMPRGRKNPFGLGPIEMMSQDKDHLDELITMTMNQVRFSIYKAFFYQGQLETEGGDGGDIRLRPDRAYKTSDPKGVSFLEVPGPGADAWRAIESRRAQVDESSGVTKPLAGEVTKSTAFEVDLAKDAALSRLSVPIANVVRTLSWDAQITFELQKQYYGLPMVKELSDPEDIRLTMEELNQTQGNAHFDIWFDESDAENPKVFRGDYRVENLSVQSLPSGAQIPALGKQEVVVTPSVFDWRGKIRVVADSLLTLMPTLERTKKLEGYNILIPMLSKPPEMFAKPARSLAKLYSIDVQDVFPAHWLEYLKMVDEGRTPQAMLPNLGGRPMNPEGGVEEAAGFEQERAEQVVTNVGGQKNLGAAQSALIGQNQNAS